MRVVLKVIRERMSNSSLLDRKKESERMIREKVL